MTNATKLIAGFLLIAVTAIEYGGTFLLGILSGKYVGFTEFQRSMFRAGHAHAGVLTILALVALIFTDQAGLSALIGWAVRIGFAAAPVLVGAGFFGAHHVARDGVRDFADVLVGEVFGDHAAPAVGAEFDGDFRGVLVSIRQGTGLLFSWS